MKRTIHILILILSVGSVKAQELNIQFGDCISNFKYSDSQGDEIQGFESTGNFFMALEYRHNIPAGNANQKLFLNLGLGYNKYGSSGSDVTVDNYYEWDVTYLGINLGLDYVFYRNRYLKFYAKGTASPEFLIHGTQTINNQVYDLVGEEDFNTPMYFFRLGVGAQFQISDRTSGYIQYMGGKSFQFDSNPESLNIVVHNIGFGLLINMSKEPYPTEWEGRNQRKKYKTPK